MKTVRLYSFISSPYTVKIYTFHFCIKHCDFICVFEVVIYLLNKDQDFL
jgi:hypothetical protein